jgi:hypothetical protein
VDSLFDVVKQQKYPHQYKDPSRNNPQSWFQSLMMQNNIMLVPEYEDRGPLKIAALGAMDFSGKSVIITGGSSRTIIPRSGSGLT